MNITEKCKQYSDGVEHIEHDEYIMSFGKSEFVYNPYSRMLDENPDKVLLKAVGKYLDNDNLGKCIGLLKIYSGNNCIKKIISVSGRKGFTEDDMRYKILKENEHREIPINLSNVIFSKKKNISEILKNVSSHSIDLTPDKIKGELLTKLSYLRKKFKGKFGDKHSEEVEDKINVLKSCVKEEYGDKIEKWLFMNSELFNSAKEREVNNYGRKKNIRKGLNKLLRSCSNIHESICDKSRNFRIDIRNYCENLTSLEADEYYLDLIYNNEDYIRKIDSVQKSINSKAIVSSFCCNVKCVLRLVDKYRTSVKSIVDIKSVIFNSTILYGDGFDDRALRLLIQCAEIYALNELTKIVEGNRITKVEWTSCETKKGDRSYLEELPMCCICKYTIPSYMLNVLDRFTTE